jgi:hypothetical protein
MVVAGPARSYECTQRLPRGSIPANSFDRNQ